MDDVFSFVRPQVYSFDESEIDNRNTSDAASDEENQETGLLTLFTHPLDPQTLSYDDFLQIALFTEQILFVRELGDC